MKEEQVSVLDPRFPSLYIFNTRNQTHALSPHTKGVVFRLKNSAASSTTPQGRSAWKAFPHLPCNIFLAACANVRFLMLVSPCKHLKGGRQGLEQIAYPTSLSKSYSVTLIAFDGFFYPLNDLSIGVLIGSTQVRFRATLPHPAFLMKYHYFFIVILHSKQKKASRSFMEVVQSLKPTQCSCLLAGCMILMFSKALSQYGTFIMHVSKTDHHFTLLNQVLLAARLCNFSVVVH